MEAERDNEAAYGNEAVGDAPSDGVHEEYAVVLCHAETHVGVGEHLLMRTGIHVRFGDHGVT